MEIANKKKINYPKNRKPRPLAEYTCTTCGVKFTSRSNIRKYCDECQHLGYIRRNREWFSRNREYNRIQQRKNHLKRRYDITVEYYEQLFTAQNGVCAICGISKNERLQVDHDHVSGKVRGLLCGFCNRSLGWFEGRNGVVLSYLGSKL